MCLVTFSCHCVVWRYMQAGTLGVYLFEDIYIDSKAVIVLCAIVPKLSSYKTYLTIDKSWQIFLLSIFISNAFVSVNFLWCTVLIGTDIFWHYCDQGLGYWNQIHGNMLSLDISAIVGSMEIQRQVLEQVRINSVYILKISKDKLVGSFKLMLLVVTPSIFIEMETSFSVICHPLIHETH
jgi:hypothetical protein